MDLDIKNRVFLVTAASKGLGFSVAKSLIDEGARVIICSRNEESLKKATRLLGKNSSYYVADLSKKDDVQELLDSITTKFGRLDGLFVNAGGPPPGPFSRLTDEDWRKAFELTLMSAVWLTRESLSL
ncbi:SDR family NAD(P)-dependent oxidoreductase, partial [Candidatus Thorarchaeota archaeon]